MFSSAHSSESCDWRAWASNDESRYEIVSSVPPAALLKLNSSQAPRHPGAFLDINIWLLQNQNAGSEVKLDTASWSAGMIRECLGQTTLRALSLSLWNLWSDNSDREEKR